MSLSRFTEPSTVAKKEWGLSRERNANPLKMSNREYSTNVALLSKLCTKNGSESDWHRFYGNYKSMITRWCRESGVDASELEDVFHEIMVKLISKLSSYDRKQQHRFRSWLKTVVLNTLTDRLRTQKPIPPPVGSADSSVAVGGVLDGAPTLDDLAEQLTEESTPAANILERVRDRVTASTWDAFIRRDLLDEETAKIAESLGIKKASVYQSVSRVRRLVQEESRKWFEPEPS
jgi:RNA polymerase sigma factor (sigma-70 family)